MDEDIVWTHLCSKTKVLESNANNSTIFEQREIFGVDLYSVITQFTKVVLISENCAKYKFNEHWNAKQKKYSENVVGLKNKMAQLKLLFMRERTCKFNYQPSVATDLGQRVTPEIW